MLWIIYVFTVTIRKFGLTYDAKFQSFISFI
jgi:hypothetical protein